MPDGQVIHVKIIKGGEKTENDGILIVVIRHQGLSFSLSRSSLSLPFPIRQRKKNGFTLWLSDRAVDSTRLSIYVYILVLRETSIIRVVTPYLYT